MRKKIIFLGLILLSFGILYLTGCAPDLSVTNWNAPDKDRALANPNDVEKLAGGAFRQWWLSQTNYYSCAWALSTMADEITSSWGNAGMKDLSSEPRKAYDNTSSYGYRYVNYNPWRYNYRALSAVNDVLGQINKGMKIIVDGEDHTVMVTAWCKFIQGIALGFIAQVFDKAFVVDETVNLETETPEPVDYMQVHQAAMQKFQDALEICNNNTFTIPEEWWPGNQFTNEDLARLIHSFMARYMADIGRSPDERDAADWAAIRAHAEQGITSDFGVDNDGNYWWSYLHGLLSNKTWARTDYKLIGSADTSGAYEQWLATPVQNRNEFLIHTDDQRITGGDPKTPGKYFKYYGPSAFRPNRGTYHFSYYHHTRYLDYYHNGYVGWAYVMSVAEMDFLIAEAALRLGDVQTAIDIINKYRVTNGGLPPVDATLPVGTPQDERDGQPYKGGLGNSLWAVLKYEKGVETIQYQCGVAWADRRGWGTLVPGTLIHFPIPGQELEILQMPYYTLGGVGQPGGAPRWMEEPQGPISLINIPKL
jgi:hypothetical protein